MERLLYGKLIMIKGIRFFDDSEDDPSECVWKYEILNEVPAHRLRLKDIKILDDWYDDGRKKSIRKKILKDIKEGNLHQHLTTHTYNVTTIMYGFCTSVQTITIGERNG
tara:strand:+ start:289 stop:615 length:327 start_codon:yes stop_codon:yes gene_type:complete